MKFKSSLLKFKSSLLSWERLYQSLEPRHLSLERPYIKVGVNNGLFDNSVFVSKYDMWHGCLNG